ncbi:MAG: copper-binding protein [Nitrospinae bacterium]|nr:copper-binding protein [Nitrospinota bacterium]
MSKALKRLDGVAKVKVNLEWGWAEVHLKKGVPLEVEKLRQAITDAGFTSSWIEVEATGEVVTRDGQVALQVTNPTLVLLLEGQVEQLSGEPGKAATVVGLLRRDKTPLTLVLGGEEFFEAEGTLAALDPERGTATINHGEIPGFMPAMQMEYHVHSKDLLTGRSPGEKVHFTMRKKAGEEATVAQLKKTP